MIVYNTDHKKNHNINQFNRGVTPPHIHRIRFLKESPHPTYTLHNTHAYILFFIEYEIY